MSLALGTKLGRYEIRSKIGAGGMGEVYQARDLDLARDVAVKVLPSTFSADTTRLHRFQQEACAAGALNHPNVLIVHDIGAHDGAPYIVSELLEGQTLRKRIGGTPLGQRRAIDYALQIAHGLAAAHEKGIIHRDLKPDNVFVTNDGRVKILDFGLAKLTQVDGDQVQTDVPTRRVDTGPGVVMGTVGYMSPEQLKAQKVDQRTDIFAFGAILYEMLSGRRAFFGQSAAETMSAILKEDPPELSSTNQSVSPALERLVNHCLEKNAEARFHSARDIAFALEALSGSSPVSGQTMNVPAVPARRWTRRELVLASVAVAGVIAALALALVFGMPYFRNAPPATRVVRTFINPPDKSSFGSFAISPDGSRLAFIAVDASGKSLLWVRPLDSFSAQPLAGTEDGTFPFWSPDSRFIGFFSGGKLKKIEVTGGTVQTLCSATVPRGGTWNKDGLIVFEPTPNDPLYQVSVAGGDATPLTTLEPSRQEASHRWPHFLPDGRHLLYAVSGGPQGQGIYVLSLDTKESRRLLTVPNTIVAYADPGYLLYRRESTLMAHAFDATKLELSGEPFPIAEPIGYEVASFQTFFSVSQNGVLAFSSSNTGRTLPTWLDRSGKEIGVLGEPSNYIRPWLSPDGKRIAVDGTDAQANRDIWLIDLVTGKSTRFTFDAGQDLFPVWSRDGSRIVFASDRQGPRNLYAKMATGAGEEQLLLKTDANTYPSDWSEDGRYLLYIVTDPKTRSDVWVLPMFGDQKPFPLLQSAAAERAARFSPDGRWIAYVSDASGVNQVYVQAFPDSGGKWQVSTNGAYYVEWRRDGKELFYVASDKKMIAVDVKGEGANFEASAPKPLFDLRIPAFNAASAQFAVTRDGQKFLIISMFGEITSAPIAVVTNWTGDVKR
ncbi:MAG TPA: protein kinase [Pyrinomonadaceae bacterium]|nr:protein kinase [Pyrinomonadaceae bacterium]